MRHGHEGQGVAPAVEALARALGAQEVRQAIPVARPPRQTRTEPVEPPVTTISRWNRVRPTPSTATTSVTPYPLPTMNRGLASTTGTSAICGLPTMTDEAAPLSWTRAERSISTLRAPLWAWAGAAASGAAIRAAANTAMERRDIGGSE